MERVQAALIAGGQRQFMLGRCEPVLRMVHAVYDRSVDAVSADVQ